MRSLPLINGYSSLAYPSTISTVTGAVSISQATPAVVTLAGHKLVLGDTVIFDAANTPAGQTNAAPPAPLVAGTEYWVVPTGTGTFNLATTYANAVNGVLIATTGGAVTTAAYTVNHYITFANPQFANGVSPYLELEDFLSNPNLFQPASTLPITNYTGVTCTSASPGVFTLALNASATIANGRQIRLGGNIPGGFSKGVTYYVVGTSTNTFNLAATPGGAAINTTSASTAASPTTVYDVTGMRLGTTAFSGEQLDVTAIPFGSPFIEGYNCVLSSDAAFLANNFTTFFIEGTSDAPGGYNTPTLNDVPSLPWTAIRSLTQAGVGTLPGYWDYVSLPQYIRVRVNVLTDFSGGGSGQGTGIVAQGTAALIGN